MPEELEDFEINPLVFTRRGAIALDALATLGPGKPAPRTPARPIDKIRRLLEPRSMAVVGVSDKPNPGRILLENTLAQGFDPENVWVVKPGRGSILGCRCVSDLGSLPDSVDLLVLAVGAAQVPGLVDKALALGMAESLILIPGGLGERSGSEGRAERLRASLAARSREGRGPVINGGNCLGIRSLPGRYDTMFIPRHKLPYPTAREDPLAIVAQSGAFAVARASKLWTLNPRYLVTIGNQVDLTAGDYLTYLRDDPELAAVACYVEGFLFIPRHKLPYPTAREDPLAIVAQSGAFAVARASKLWTLNPRYLVTIGNQVDLTAGDYLTYLRDDPELAAVACYVEGFLPGDGGRWLEAARSLSERVVAVILYRALRTAAGARATASHTASTAGYYAVSRELATAAGALVARSLADFEDLVRLAICFAGRELGGRRLGALSNAGFECVAFADSLSDFELPTFGDATRERVKALLERRRLGDVVGVTNPLDVTPILDDGAFVEAARAVLEPAVDLGVIGCVPLTGALQTLAAGPDHREDVERSDALAARLGRLGNEVAKPWVAVIYGGPLYDPLTRALEERRIPVFRTADRALRLLDAYCRWRHDR